MLGRLGLASINPSKAQVKPKFSLIKVKLIKTID